MSEHSGPPSRWEKLSQVATVLMAPVALLVLVLWFAVFLPWFSKFELDVFAHREEISSDFWTIHGRVRHDGNDAAGVRVWAVVHGTQGNRDSPAGDLTKSDGQFTITNVPRRLNRIEPRTVEIYARLTKDKRELKGLEVLRLDETVSLGTTGPAAAIGVLAALLLLSMVPPLVRGAPGRTRYVFSMVLAVLFSFGVIATIGYGLYKVHSTKPTRVPLGFITVFRGTYVENAPDEWLLSLSDPGQPSPLKSSVSSEATAPKDTAADGARTGAVVQAASSDSDSGKVKAVKGFGAPLWVILLAVVGAGILTVSLMTREIKSPAETEEKRRDRIYYAVQHQVYILFAPIGAIFVYQTMVVTNTAGHPLMVAVAALGAGGALNALLKYAVQSATKLFPDGEPKPAPATAPPTG